MNLSTLSGSCFAAWFDFGVRDFFDFVLRMLAVFAAAFVGYLCSGWVVRTLVRLAFHKETPRPIEGVSRVVGAVVLGLIVWTIWPGLGGTGTGRGGEGGVAEGGSGKDKGGGKDQGGQPGKDKKEGPSASEKVVIQLIPSGQVKNDLAYRIDDEKGARNLAQVEEYLKLHKPKEAKKGWVEIVWSSDTVSENVGVHKALVDRVRQNFDPEPILTKR
jgi:hypothetical protein